MSRADLTDPAAPLAATDRRVGFAQRAARVLIGRRLIVVCLNIATIGALSAAMLMTLGSGGWSAARIGMFAAFVVTLPWLSIGFWNAVIGALLLARGDSGRDPLRLPYAAHAPITTRTAITMAIRNEDPDRAVMRLGAIQDELDASGFADAFDIHLLSDTDDPDIAAREAAAFAAWQATSGRPEQLFYRRRSSNEGFKAGNLQEFCERTKDAYAFFLPLDADSYLSAATILKLVRLMEQNPRVGILQTLVVGTPSTAFFTRVFQFGMRHGMRAYTAGAAWWAGDCGPYWGHNALIRMDPFARACRLPVLPGNGPLGGQVMSHDQVEATFMRRAGYHVRVVVEEGESWEENPPTLPDFIRREIRWCQGNMQYFQLIGLPGLKAMSRVQLALAVLMYLGGPAWMTFIIMGALSIFDGVNGGFSPGVAIVLFASVIIMTLAPKLMGLAGILASRAQSARYGGRLRVLAGGAAELVMSTLMAPVVAFAIAVFVGGLLVGKRIEWRAQPRGDRTVGWNEAARCFWPQTLFGLTLLGLLGATLPSVLPWAAPVIVGLVLAIPVAVATASRGFGRWSVSLGVCDIPEDRVAPPALSRLLAPASAPAKIAAAAPAAAIA